MELFAIFVVAVFGGALWQISRHLSTIAGEISNIRRILAAGLHDAESDLPIMALIKERLDRLVFPNR